ncbi:DUF3526 domain-containing protein [Paludisphaera soli]|uniref:DUF3526 domain-containing protein n=1 Tax=Paludisphaera soli TaxID=2712865 RepID=UPI0013EA0D17|nr:DUF3526 domain-containing protein [Paludisphaera soli]
MKTTPATTLERAEPRIDRPRTSPFRAAMGCEWRLARDDFAWWAAVALLVGCVAYAIQEGRARIDARARALAEAALDEERRLGALTVLLGRIDRGEEKAPAAPYRDPRNAIYVGRGQGAALAHLPDAPLAIAAVGLSDLYPQVLKVSAGIRDGFLFADEIANPAGLLHGGFDLAFVLVSLYPMLLLAVCYNVLSGEREQGTLALLAASSAPLARVLLGKLAVRAGGLTAAAIVAAWVGLALAHPSSFRGGGLMRLTAFTGAVALYGAFWTALALFVNSFRRDSAFNAVALVMAWVVLLLVAPATINAAAQVLYPAPARSEMIEEVRAASVDAERDLDAAEARYREEHAEAKPAGDGRSRRTLEVTIAADARADEVLARQEARIREQRALCDRLAFLAPPIMFHDALAELAGNGHTRWDDYLARVADFHETWKSFFVDRAGRDARLTADDYAHFPRFDPDASGPASADASARRVAASLASIALAAVVLFAWSTRRLARAG